MERPRTQSALVFDHLVLRTTTEEAAIDHLRQALNQGHSRGKKDDCQLPVASPGSIWIKTSAPFPMPASLSEARAKRSKGKAPSLKARPATSSPALAAKSKTPPSSRKPVAATWSVENKNHWKPNPRALPWAAVECPFGALEHGISSANGATHDSLGQPP